MMAGLDGQPETKPVAPDARPAISLRGIDKRFGAVHANKAIDLDVARGSIHGIVGENGAGKSTLMSILYGFYQADAGTVSIHGEPVTIRSSRDAIAAGIGMVHQHFMLVEPFTVLENVLLGNEGGPLLAGGRGVLRQKLLDLSRDYALEVDPDAIVGDLPIGAQQRVEILKALIRGADLLILDEPTGVLTPEEADHLFRILAMLRDQGTTVLIITHKLREIMAITDHVSVMRQGAMVAHLETASTSVGAIAEAMVGHRVTTANTIESTPRGAPVLTARGLGFANKAGVTLLENFDITLHAGEIVGIAGVSGNGQSEVLSLLSGMAHPTSGTITLNGKKLPADPALVRAMGLAHVPEDRLRLGLVKRFEARENAILGHEGDEALGTPLHLSRNKVTQSCDTLMRCYDVRPRDPRLRTANFSGGNQQKLVIAREFERDPAVLIVGQPTRGVDIGAIAFIHAQLLAMKKAGKAILIVSVELDEIFALSDRILVLCGGRLVGERVTRDTDEREIGLMMTGIEGKNQS